MWCYNLGGTNTLWAFPTSIGCGLSDILQAYLLVAYLSVAAIEWAETTGIGLLFRRIHKYFYIYIKTREGPHGQLETRVYVKQNAEVRRNNQMKSSFLLPDELMMTMAMYSARICG